MLLQDISEEIQYETNYQYIKREQVLRLQLYDNTSSYIVAYIYRKFITKRTASHYLISLMV